MEILNKVKTILTNDIDVFKLGEGLSPAIYIMLIGAVLILLAFFIALIIVANGKANAFRKKLDDATAYVNATGVIDQSNLGGVYERIKAMPAPVAKGWSAFLEQQTGYPSDYIAEKDVLGDRKAYASGKGFYTFVSTIAILIAIALSAICGYETFVGADVDVSLVANVVKFVLPVLGTLVVPSIVYAIFDAFLALANKNSFKKLSASFRAFQDSLDNNVIIFSEAQDEFIEENIEEINSAIEDILANKLEDNEIVVIVNPPKAEGEAVEETPVQEEPVEEVAAATPAVEEPVEEEVQEEDNPFIKLLELVNIADKASKDPKITEEELLELAVYYEEVKNEPEFADAEIQELLTDCMIILSDAYYTRFAE